MSRSLAAMIVPGVPFDEISESHLLALIENGYSERRTVEYKRDLPGGKDDDKKEFLADVSSRRLRDMSQLSRAARVDFCGRR